MLKPIVKWAGGKRQLLSELIPLIEELRPRDSTYVEPFVGGGAVLFKLQPIRALINDLNFDLINVYNVVRDHVEELISMLKIHEFNHCKEYFYMIRALDRSKHYGSMNNVERAARIIYLNRTCYNGLYRVNASGYFNVPFGRYVRPNIVNEATLRAASTYLRNNDVTILNSDYRSLIDRLESNSFVYFDPPYQPLSVSSSFTAYTDAGFDYARQIELRDVCLGLMERNIPFVESNSDCEEIRELYKGFEVRTVQATRALNRDVCKRGAINELMIYYRRRGGD